MERQRQKMQRDQILEEIRKRRNNSKYTSEEWQNLVEKKYNELKSVVIDNIPDFGQV